VDKRAFIKDMLDKGKIDKVRYDKGIAKFDSEDANKLDYQNNKGKMTDKQRLDRIEKILGL
jgi:hypothetical protein